MACNGQLIAGVLAFGRRVGGVYYVKYMECGAHVGYVRDKVVPAVCSHFGRPGQDRSLGRDSDLIDRAAIASSLW